MTYVWMPLRDLRYSHMTARAASVKSIKSSKGFSQERQEPLKESLPLKPPYCMLKEVSSSDFVLS